MTKPAKQEQKVKTASKRNSQVKSHDKINLKEKATAPILLLLSLMISFLIMLLSK